MHCMFHVFNRWRLFEGITSHQYGNKMSPKNSLSVGLSVYICWISNSLNHGLVRRSELAKRNSMMNFMLRHFLNEKKHFIHITYMCRLHTNTILKTSPSICNCMCVCHFAMNLHSLLSKQIYERNLIFPFSWLVYVHDRYPVQKRSAIHRPWTCTLDPLKRNITCMLHPMQFMCIKFCASLNSFTTGG